MYQVSRCCRLSITLIMLTLYLHVKWHWKAPLEELSLVLFIYLTLEKNPLPPKRWINFKRGNPSLGAPPNRNRCGRCTIPLKTPFYRVLFQTCNSLTKVSNYLLRKNKTKPYFHLSGHTSALLIIYNTILFSFLILFLKSIDAFKSQCSHNIVHNSALF